MTESTPARIQSRDNPRFKKLRLLATSAHRGRKTELALLDGEHLLEAYCANGGVPEQVIISESGAADGRIARWAQLRCALGSLLLPDALFREIATVATPTGVAALIRTPAAGGLPARIAECVLLDRIQDAGNLGSILRSTAAAGIDTVLLSKGCAYAWSAKVLRAGMGAHFRLKIFDNVDLAAAVPRLSSRLISSSSHARRSIFDADLRMPVAWLFGNEGGGVVDDLRRLSAEEVAIPMAANTESLNVAAAAAICLFEQARQRRCASRKRD